MSLLVDLLARTSVILLAGFAVLAVCRSRSAAVRHLILLATLAATAAVVPLGLLLPSWPLPGGAAPADMAGTVVTVSTAPALEAPSAPVMALRWEVLWAAGATLGAAHLLIALWRLRRLSRAAIPLKGPRWDALLGAAAAAHGLRRPVALLVAGGQTPPATWGLWRPKVLLPSHAHAWDPGRARAVLSHELAHIARHDWSTQLAAEALRVLLWFHPLVWAAAVRLRRESELACDDEVLRVGIGADEYASHLLALARRCRPAPLAALPMARQSTLERRITAMLSQDLDRTRPSVRVLATSALLWCAVTLPVAALTGAQAGPRTLSGAIYDMSGALLPAVAVTLDTSGAAPRDTVTDAAGRFEFPATPPGRHTLKATIAGFRPLEYTIDLARDRDWVQAITLQVGTVREEIAVQAPRIIAAKPRAEAPQPLRVGGNLRPPRKTRDVRPIYPEAMRAAGVEGIVPLEAVIAKDGSVQSVRVLSAGVHPALAAAAVDAMRQWRFEATLLNGSPVDVVMTTVVQFMLTD